MKKTFELIGKLRNNRVFICVLIVSALSFFFYRMAKQWDEVLTYEWKFSISYLTLCLAILILLQAGNALSWKFILKLLGEKLSFMRCFSAHALSHIARYVPPKGAGYALLIEMLKNSGIPRKSGIIAVTMNISFQLISSAILFMVSTKFLGEIDPSLKLRTLWILTPLIFLLLQPGILFPMVNLILKSAGKEPVKASYGYPQAIEMTFLFISLRLWEGLGLWFLLRSFYQSSIDPISMAGIFSISFAVGFIAVFSPGGLVVREGVMVSLLQRYMPVEVAMSFAILSRAILTTVDLLIGATSYKLGAKFSPKSPFTSRGWKLN